MRARMAIPLLVAVLVATSSCRGSPAPPRNTTAVKVIVRDFRLVVRPATVPAGWLALQISNQGPDTHEVIIVRTATADTRLPLRSDGITVDEDALQARMVGSADVVLPGTKRMLRVHLAPGRYELFCNMAGHYGGGMHTWLLVTAVRP